MRRFNLPVSSTKTKSDPYSESGSASMSELHKDPYTEIENMYDELKQNERNFEIVQKEHDELSKRIKNNQKLLKNLEIKRNRLLNRAVDIKSKIRTEKEKIKQCHEEVIRKLRENNKILTQSLIEARLKSNNPIITQSVASVNPDDEYNMYRKNLRKHMEKYKSDPWYEILLYTFEYRYIPENVNDTLSYVKSIADMPICNDCSQPVKSWLNHNEPLLKKSVLNKCRLLHFMILLKNIIHRCKKQPTMSKQQLFAKYNITL